MNGRNDPLSPVSVEGGSEWSGISKYNDPPYNSNNPTNRGQLASPPISTGLGPFRDSLRIEYPATELASEGRRILGPGPLTGVPFPFLLGGPLIEDAGLPMRLMSPPANRGNLRSSS